MNFPSIVNRGEYFSAHYLDALLQHDLGGLRDSWKAAEAAAESTPRTRLRRLPTAFFAAKAAAVDGDPSALRDVHDASLDALGFTPDRRTLERTRGSTQQMAVPVVHAAGTDEGLLLVALEAANWADDVDAAQDPEGAGRLNEPVVLDGDAITEVTEAVGAMFTSDDPPRYVLWLAGGVLLLADRTKWAEGRFLAVNLDLALEARDVKAKGELETIAALFSADALLPAEEGQSVLDQLISSSHRHAVAVSEELREGVRRSVEILANEVIEQRLAARKAVYTEPDLPRELTQQCLRFLYRLLFLLYAEARPELGILPLDDPEYQEGYGLDRLRDLALTELHSETARNGHHLHSSLNLLFRLINSGHHHDATQQRFVTPDDDQPSDGVGIVFEPLHSELFSSDATPLIDSVRLRNATVQRILELLLLSREEKGAGRGFVSYSQLGINQLGAVYEGLMAYSGFLADDELYEVFRPGAKEHPGTWALPVSDADSFPDEVFVTEVDERTGERRRVRHPKGSFVFRLAGRDRQRSASYYTPEVLTSCVVRHALAELIDDDVPASDLLELTICEPALGSGAFVNEAITQLAQTYLDRRQRELGETLDPDRYAFELQRVKTHFALHQSYGVDLNHTAVELAEVSLWLNAMHQGLRAPWFGLHLRRGNSLVGASRSTYRSDQLEKQRWLTEPPTDRPLADATLGPSEVHHFLLPAAGWAAVADAKQAKELRPEARDQLKQWRKAVTKTLSVDERRRVQALAHRVEALWELATQRIAQAEGDLRRPLHLYGQPQPEHAASTARDRLDALLEDDSSPLGRLRLVMDAWCALWYWPIDGDDGPPTPPARQQWLDALEGLLGTVDLEPGSGQLNLLDLLETDEGPDDQLRFAFGMRTVEAVLNEHPWLHTTRDIAAREGFFHWELEFAPIFARGGFDLVAGNPPWVRLDWEDDIVLAELDPWFGVTTSATTEETRQRRQTVLEDSAHQRFYLDELASNTGLVRSLGDGTRRPLLTGIRTNLYMVFMDTSWRLRSSDGIVGLLHPEGHFTEPRGGPLREQSYRRLRRLWVFLNEAKLFEDVDNRAEFGVHIYGQAEDVDFRMIGNVHLPETVDASLEHDGAGEVPGIKRPDGQWDRRPHASRVVDVTDDTLTTWARLFDDEATSPRQARLVRVYSQEDLSVLETFARQPRRLSDLDYRWSSGLNEKNAKVDGIIRRETTIPPSWDEVILQGPHFGVATPFAKQPNPGCKSNKDYSPWDLTNLPEHVLPRTNYQRACPRDQYDAAVGSWQGSPLADFFRVVTRRMVGTGAERSLHPAIIVPGPAHVDPCNTLAVESPVELLRIAALWSSLPFDHLLRVSGKSDFRDELASRLPMPQDPASDPALLLRAARLNCLTRDYEPFWEAAFDDVWRSDAFTSDDGRLPALGEVERAWTMATPLRSDLARRQALVELDALAALLLGVECR